MCGICGYVGEDHPEWLPAMLDAIAHRGPDYEGVWSDAIERVGLGHRRLSILDLSPAGRQPMSNEDKTVWVTFNGEIYNFGELREKLISRGHRFQSHSDTEVLVHLYEERGADMLGELNGMFAFALWDTNRKQLLLARDHAGIKPLYYCTRADRLAFASEMKSLLRLPGFPRELNQAAVETYLTFLWVPGQQTMLKGIEKLEPGHYLIWKEGKVEIRRWFALEYYPDDSVAEDDWVERIRDTFLRVTRRQMVSDVPLGAFLSGGVDSSSIVASMREAFPDRPITCYTARIDPNDAGRDRFVDDYPYACLVAQHLNVKLKEFVLRPNVIELLPKLIWHLDEPDADPAVFPSYLVSKSAREDGTTVLLSGTGGDEIFFGYRSHEAYCRYASLHPRLLKVFLPVLSLASIGASALLGAQHPLVRRTRKFRRGLVERGLARHLAIVDWSSPEARDALMGTLASTGNGSAAAEAIRPYFDCFRGEGEINRHSHLLIQTFLAAHNFLYTDKASMACSLEVRVPFLDLELMRLCAKIPEGLQLKNHVPKYLLKRAMAKRLPHDVLYRSKTGFMAPLRKWIAEDLREVIAEFLSPTRVRARGLFDPIAVTRIIEENRANRADHAYLIYALLSLEIWQQTFIDRPGEEANLSMPPTISRRFVSMCN
jgi:asparagine synthase (glutamine-hydrolysing)